MENTKDAGIRGMKLKADGITCAGCATDMENVLRNTEGILDASVNFSSEIIDVGYNPAVLNKKQVFAAISRLGYKVKIISES